MAGSILISQIGLYRFSVRNPKTNGGITKFTRNKANKQSAPCDRSRASDAKQQLTGAGEREREKLAAFTQGTALVFKLKIYLFAG